MNNLVKLQLEADNGLEILARQAGYWETTKRWINDVFAPYNIGFTYDVHHFYVVYKHAEAERFSHLSEALDRIWELYGQQAGLQREEGQDEV